MTTMAGIRARRATGPTLVRPSLWRRVLRDRVVLLSVLFLAAMTTATIVATLHGVDASTARSPIGCYRRHPAIHWGLTARA